MIQSARVAALRAELEALVERPRQAILEYELGHAIERETGVEAQAVREYLAAYNLDPSFRPPLFALVRIFERRRSFKNLSRLYEAEAKSSTAPAEHASALVDRAVLLEDQLDQPEQARELLKQALAEDPSCTVAALMLEKHALRGGDRAAAAEVLSARAASTEDPVLHGLLLLDVARAKEDAGDVDGALEAARAAARLHAGRFRFLAALERLARRHDRVPDLVAALESRAALAAAAARGEERTVAGSGVFALDRLGDAAKAGVLAAALYRDAAALRLSRLGDAAGARHALAEALVLRPDDLALRREHMLACELDGDAEAAARDARTLLDSGITGPHAAGLEFRIAEHAQASGDGDGAAAALERAAQASPESAVATAMLEEVRLGIGDVAGVVARLRERAEALSGPARAELAWRGAFLATRRLGDFAAARPLFAMAIEGAADRGAVLRDLLGESLRAGDAVAAKEAIRGLLTSEPPIDDEERSALLRDLHELERMVIEDHVAADGVLREALASPACASWAPDVARLYAAETRDGALLADAHRALADVGEAEVSAAHLSAAARALARSGRDDEAIAALTQALERVPAHPYAVALLEELYRRRGDADAVVKLLRDAAESGGRRDEAQLLLAGAAAEAKGDHALAARTYEEALDRNPDSLAPLLALDRLARRRGDSELALKALERLSEHELASGKPGRATLELGEHYHLRSGKPELAEVPLRSALDQDELSPFAALELAMLGESAHQGGATASILEGVRMLVAAAGEQSRPGIQRELGSMALMVEEPMQVEEAANALLAGSPDERWALLARLRACWGDPSKGEARAQALLALADATDDTSAAAELVLAGLRAATYAQVGTEDAVLRAAGFDASGSLTASIAATEALDEAADPGERADALGTRLAFATPLARPALVAERARTLVEAGRAADAVPLLVSLCDADERDLAAFETLRAAARDAEAWPEVVRACDRLAAAVDGELRAQLLEESAAVLMDHVGDDEGAERRLRQALAIDGTREIAHMRLRDMLAERGDDAGLLTLVQARIALTDDPERLAPLFYEQARLHRVLRQRDEALAALDNLLMLEPQHVGGLALLVELNVQREAWREAVVALRTLAGAPDVPASQRRIARLGAADFLEKKLRDDAGALAELAAVAELGLGDVPLHERMADLAERSGDTKRTANELQRAAELASDPERRAALERRHGRVALDRLGDASRARDAYRRALAAVPTDVAAGNALAEIVDPLERGDLSFSVEGAVRAALASDPTDPALLRALAKAVDWRGETSLGFIALRALLAIDEIEPEEQTLLEQDTEVLTRLRAGSASRLSPQSLDALEGGASAPMAGVVRELAVACAEVLAEMDRLEPGTFGMGRAELVNAKQPTPVFHEVNGLAALLGAVQGDVWVGGREPALLTVAPSYKGKPAWLVGGGVAAPLSSTRRFAAAQLALSLRTGLVPLAQRAHSLDAIGAAILGVCAAAGAPLPIGEVVPGTGEVARAAAKVISRKSKKLVPELAARVGDGGRPIAAWTRAYRASLARIGVLVSGDLRVGLEWTLGAPPMRETVKASPDARGLFEFWISTPALALRRELGLST